MLAWLSVWGEVQICIWPSYHCHSLYLAPVNPDWFYLLVPAHTGSPRQRAVKWVLLARRCLSVAYIERIYAVFLLTLPSQSVGLYVCLIFLLCVQISHPYSTVLNAVVSNIRFCVVGDVLTFPNILHGLCYFCSH